MQIIMVENDKCRLMSEYFDFNQISYSKSNLWDPDVDTFGRHVLNFDFHQVDSILLIVNTQILFTLYSWSKTKDQLVDFCNNGNKIWVHDDIDSLVNLVYLSHEYDLVTLDHLVPTGSIRIFLDGELSDRHPLTKLNNIKISVLPYNFCLHRPRIQNSQCEKTDCSRDFMLTMRKKITAPHRSILYSQLGARDGLMQMGHVNYTNGNNRIGKQSTQHTWHDGFPSMDLYQDSWLEIVPETLYKHGFFVTEKTVKPLATKTPFLVVSTCRYLDYLKKFGFQTFGSVIDESYDQQPRLEDRVRMMLDQLEEIVRNGTESFYHSCRHILEHNQSRLFEISGRKEYDLDIFLRQCLEQDNVL